MCHTTPIGDHGDPQRILEKTFGGERHAAKKYFYSPTLFVAIESGADSGRLQSITSRE